MPSHISPHKIGINSAESKHRLAMIELAINSIENFESSNYEILNEEISYTHSTLCHLKKNYDNIELIIGYDNYLTFHKWKNYLEIFDLCKVIVMQRITDIKEAEHDLKENFVFVKSPRIDISSSEIRERILNNKKIDYLVPDLVNQYIIKNKLYL